MATTLIRQILEAAFSPWLWMAVVGSVLVLTTSPVPGFFRRGRPKIELVREGSSDRVVVFVHGTFAQSAKWTTRKSNLLRNLGQIGLGEFVCYRLLWTGCNFHRDREMAVRHLHGWLEGLGPQVDVCLIGHSHGGNIAALAASRVGDRPIKVVTLSTPFIAASLRSLTFLPVRDGRQEVRDQRYLITAVSFLTSVLLFAPLLIRDARWIAAAAVAAMGLNMTVLRFLPTATSVRDRWIRELTVDVNTDRLLILRATGDEASGLLGISAVIGSLFNFVLRLVGVAASVARSLEEAALRRMRFAVPLTLVFTLLALLLQTDTQTLEQRLPTWLANFIIANSTSIFWAWVALAITGIGAVSGLLAPVLAVVGTFVSMILATFFGLDMALIAIFATVSAEATPIGRSFVSNRPGGSWGIAHSYLYDAPGTAYEIQRFWNESSPRT